MITLPSTFAGYVAYWVQYPQNNEKATILIEKGASLSQIAQTLNQYKVLNSPLLFKLTVYATGASQKLKAGEYLIPPSITPAQLIHILKSGEVILHGVTLIEGETCHRLIEKVTSNAHFQGACETPEEGVLLPETYYFPHGTECYIILSHMKKAMTYALEAAWAERCDNHPLGSPQELLVLASIIEKETSKTPEKPLVAAVFLNRLRQGMLLIGVQK